MKSALDILPIPSGLPTPVAKGFNLKPKEIQQAWETDTPLNLSLYLGSRCNLRCQYCFTSAGEATDDNLSWSEQIEIIDQAFKLGVQNVMFAGRGEPLLDENLWGLLEYVQAKGGWNLVFTNATLITPRVASRLWQLGCTVMTKVNSFVPKIQDELADTKGTAGMMYKGIRNLMEAGFNQSRPTRLANDNLICRQNFREIPQMLEYFMKQNVQSFVETLLLAGRAVENRHSLEVTPSQLAWLYQTLHRRGLSYAGGVNYSGQGCIAETITIMVTEHGNVVPCWGRETLIAGNIRISSLIELWFSTMLTGLRQSRRRHIEMVRAGALKAGECPGRCYAKSVLEGGTDGQNR